MFVTRYVSPVEFRNALLRAKRVFITPVSAGLHEYSLREYAEMRTFLGQQGRSGYAIKPDGDLVNLFSCSRGKGQALLKEAVANGAKKLDCYDGSLVGIYQKAGFREVGREPFDREIGPSVLSGLRPDVVYMEYIG